MTYKHLSIEERAVIAFLIRNGESVRSAAKAIGSDMYPKSWTTGGTLPAKGPSASNITRGRPRRWLR